MISTHSAMISTHSAIIWTQSVMISTDSAMLSTHCAMISTHSVMISSQCQHLNTGTNQVTSSLARIYKQHDGQQSAAIYIYRSDHHYYYIAWVGSDSACEIIQT